MPRAVWPLLNERPMIEVVLPQTNVGQPATRRLLADTGAGRSQSDFELFLEATDCSLYGGRSIGKVRLGGAYSGSFRVYEVRVQVPALGFDQVIRVVAVPAPAGFNGIACFRFLNRFTYGNFGDPNQFGLETTIP